MSRLGSRPNFVIGIDLGQRSARTVAYPLLKLCMEACMRAMDIMTPNVITVGPETLIHALARLLLQHGISGFPSSTSNSNWSA